MLDVNCKGTGSFHVKWVAFYYSFQLVLQDLYIEKQAINVYDSSAKFTEWLLLYGFFVVVRDSWTGC